MTGAYRGVVAEHPHGGEPLIVHHLAMQHRAGQHPAEPVPLRVGHASARGQGQRPGRVLDILVDALVVEIHVGHPENLA